MSTKLDVVLPIIDIAQTLDKRRFILSLSPHISLFIEVHPIPSESPDLELGLGRFGH